jgi:hypothetical protein
MNGAPDAPIARNTSATAALLRAQTRHTPEAVLNGVNIPLVAVCCLHLLGHESRSSSSVPNFQHAEKKRSKRKRNRHYFIVRCVSETASYTQSRGASRSAQ